MSKLSFKTFAKFVDLEGEVSDEQINEIFGLFKNNSKVEKLRKEREKLKNMSAEKKAQIDRALQDFASGDKPLPAGAHKDVTWDDILSVGDRKVLKRQDKYRDEKDNTPKNKTGKNFYESNSQEKDVVQEAGEQPTVKAFKIKAKRGLSNASIWEFIESQAFITIEDFELKGSTLYLYPLSSHHLAAPYIKDAQKALQASFDRFFN